MRKCVILAALCFLGCVVADEDCNEEYEKSLVAFNRLYTDHEELQCSKDYKLSAFQWTGQNETKDAIIMKNFYEFGAKLTAEIRDKVKECFIELYFLALDKAEIPEPCYGILKEKKKITMRDVFAVFKG